MMETAYQPLPQTIAVVALACIAYMALLARKAAAGRLDFYDVVMLSSAAILPAIFIFLPKIGEFVSALVGATPFSVLFGLLFLVAFVFMHRLTIQAHSFERRTRLLIQEVSMLKQQMETRQRPDRDGSK